MYVTLSAEFFNTNIVDEAVADGSRLMENGLLSRAEYEARVENAREEMYLARRLAAQSIVNTITANRPDVSVQLLFELNGSAARVRRTELGLETFGSGSHDLLEPMGFDDSYVITAPGVVACLLEHIQNGEYDKAYPLIAELEQGGAYQAKPREETEQVSLDAIGEAEVLAAIRRAQPDTMSPIEAMQLLYELKQKLS